MKNYTLLIYAVLGSALIVPAYNWATFLAMWLIVGFLGLAWRGFGGWLALFILLGLDFFSVNTLWHEPAYNATFLIIAAMCAINDFRGSYA